VFGDDMRQRLPTPKEKTEIESSPSFHWIEKAVQIAKSAKKNIEDQGKSWEDDS
jgi:hypothetical protein